MASPRSRRAEYRRDIERYIVRPGLGTSSVRYIVVGILASLGVYCTFKGFRP